MVHLKATIWFVLVVFVMMFAVSVCAEEYGMGLRIPEEVKEYWQTHTPQFKYNTQNFLSSVDWSSNDSPVKNQGTCGSCWAFASVAIVENVGDKSDLAEQVIISCVSESGCYGGWYGYALEYIGNSGIPPEACYPYTASNGNCSNMCNDPEYLEKVSQYDTYSRWGDPDGSTVDNLKALLQSGPVCASMLVPEGTSFTGYSGGIYNYSGGPIPEERGHAILVVGYDESQQYFKVKNSWGTWWGEGGYFRIAYDDVTDDVQFGGWACIVSGAYTEWGVDTVPPTMEDIVEAEGGYYETAPSFSNFGFDDNVDLDDGWYQLNACDGSWTSLFTNVSGTSWDGDGWTIPGFETLPEGSNIVYFRADDDADNRGGGCTWSWQFYKVNPDTEPPTMEDIVEAEGQYYETAPTFSNFGFDDNENLDDGWYQIDSFSSGGWVALFTNVNGTSWDSDGWEIPGFGNLTEGSHTVYFKADDDAGNSGGQNGEWNWQFHKIVADTEPPTMEPIVEAEGQTYETAPNFSNFGFDDDEDLDDGWYQINSYAAGGWNTLFSNANGQSWDADGWSIPGFGDLTNGSHTIYFKADDDAGNCAGQSGEWSWQFYKVIPDTEPPTMEEIVEDEGQVYETAPIFTNFGFDDNEDLDEGGYQIDSYTGSWTVLFVDVSGSSWDHDGWEVPGFGELSDGSHTIYFMVRDDAGNGAGENGGWSWQFHKEAPDTEPPTMEEIVEAEGQYYDSSPVFSNFGFDDNDNLDAGWYQLNSCTGTWVQIFSGVNGPSWDDDGWTLPSFDNLPEGSNIIYFRARDDADNIGGGCMWSWHFYKVTSDTEPPTMEGIVEAEGQSYETAPTFSNFGFDDDEDLDDGWYQIDSFQGSWTPVFVDVNGTSWDHDGWEIPGFNELSDGGHTIYFKADDDADNCAGQDGEWSWQFHKETPDTEPPTMEPIVEAEGQYYNQPPVFSNFGFDDNEDLDDGSYQIDSYTGPWIPLFVDAHGSTWNGDWWEIPGFFSLSEGSHTIHFWVDDDAGYVGEAVG